MSARWFAAAAVALLTAAACGGDDDRELVGYVREPLPEVDTVALPDVGRGGDPFEMRAPEGGLLVVYFGYTNCPHECPTTLADLRFALRDLGDDASRIDVAMVTVDPDRDTDVLADYVRSFVDGAHALATDDAADLQAAAAPFGVSYAVTPRDDGGVDVAHSTQLYVVDDDGRLRLTWPFGVSADDMAGDLDQLLDRTDA
jgi:protein SCO1